MIKQFSDLPGEIQDFLVDITGPDWAKKAAVSFGLPQEKVAVLLGLAERLTLQIDLLGLLPTLILSEIEIEWEVARKIAIDLAGNRLLPIKSFLGIDIEGQIRAWGGDPAVFKDIPKISFKVSPPVLKESENPVEKVLNDLGIILSDKMEQSRLVFILSSFVNGSRTKEETLAAFSRFDKVGGLNMTEVDAKSLLDRFLSKAGDLMPVRSVATPAKAPVVNPRRFIDIKPPAPKPVPSSVPLVKKVAPPTLPTPSVAPTKPAPVSPPATPVRPVHHFVLPPKPVVPAKKIEGPFELDELESKQPANTKTQAVSFEQLATQITTKVGLIFDDVAKKKFVTAVEARLRDVRDAFETRDLFERPVDQGGLAISGAQLVSLMEELEKVFDTQQADGRLKIENDKKVAFETKAAAKVEADKIAAEKAKATKPKIIPKPLTLAVSPASRSLQSTGGRPQMTDIVSPSRRLSGPIDELKNLSVDEFRRLSTDPKEATIKIHDKINLLEEQGIGQKIAGIKAWRSSPTNQLYLTISQAALMAGKSIDDAAHERVVAGEPSLTAEEMHAINSLNGTLRF